MTADLRAWVNSSFALTCRNAWDLLSRTIIITTRARIFHELLSRDNADGRATWQPQGVGSEAYLNGTSQGPISEDAREDVHIRGRSKLFMKYPG